VQNEDGSWTVSDLLRGRRGTDSFCGTHAASEIVILLNLAGLVRVDCPNSILGVLRYYRAVPNGSTLDSIDSQSFTDGGGDLKPLSPVAIGGTQNADGDMTISWLRRTRFGGAYGTGNESYVDCLGGPINEQSESYEVDILGGSPEEVKRTITTTVPTAVYTKDQQIADFGSQQSSISVEVYQISAAVGRGWPGTGTCPASTDAPAVSPGGGQFYIN
jgi:hypothetical protein